MPLSNFFSDGSPVFLAPMAGITDAPFRELVSSFGITAVVSEMISSEALVRNSKKTYRRLINQGKNFVNIIQIVGADPKNMSESARINESFGADIIDINMGCPARKIVSNGAGSALMKNEDLAVEIAESIVKSVKIPITLKMRLGWDAENINFFALAKKFEEAGIQMLTIHCRTRSQMYSGKADWAAISGLKDAIKIPYLCNGDINSKENASIALKESGANGIMVGRASLGRPWFPNEVMNFLNSGRTIFPPCIEEQYKILMMHFNNVLDFYGKIHGIRIFRKHFCWYTKGLNDSSIFRENINRTEDITSIKNYVEAFYTKHFQAIL